MKKPIIEFKDFTFKYLSQAEPTLRNIDLTIYEGEKVLIAGASGSGKSTLAHCINGLIPHSYKGDMSGVFRINGNDTKNMTLFDISKDVGTVLQDTDGQFIGLTVGEDIAFTLENDLIDRDELIGKTKVTAKIVSMEDYLEVSPHDLSGGQKQRVSMAGVIVGDVKILLFDEPLASLDPATGKKTIELIDEIMKQRSSTVVIIEHRLEEVLYKEVDRIILLENGIIKADMSPDELLSSCFLVNAGIREPLYLSALKYAGCPITKDINPSGIDSISIDDDNKKKVQNWCYGVQLSESPRKDKVLLELKDISFNYNMDKNILKQISFKVHKGEMLGIVGCNGAGKSTLAKVICGFESNFTGEIHLNDNDISNEDIKEKAKHIGYVMQNPNQMISKSMIFDEVALVLYAQGISEEEVKKRVEDTLKVCGLYEFRNWPISALSFGQKKRVTIASILVTNPEIIILDEPTAGQDFRHYTEFMEFLKRLNSEGVTVIMITHDMHLMLEYISRVLVFSDGEIIADNTPVEILTNHEIIEKANLKETSLFNLAEKCNISDPKEFIKKFIHYDRQVRG
ncbi:ABC transporter ATP-binding protein [Clostridium cylindrosporum]|uniref:Putative ABC transporter ATP-binding protein n=1 Tax=Clostridium cylindrosporum DSM 605 TaxID=1121307 RepID=A0A0J8D834_CLOCY|nr:ABC transporter ATP-binding protein [Clostridium cylindrosporum]KMT22017.1 putative ABC transporter ATP-binding protein [Clostridium cylindrosporum DSM 605]